MIFFFFSSYCVSHSWGIPMMEITGLSHLFKWENLHNWWLTKYFFAPLYMSSRSSASERRITVPSQRGTKSLSQTFSLTVPIWWNDLELNPSSWNLTHLQETAKTHLFIFIWSSNSSTLYSHFIISNLSSFYLKNTHIWPSINCIFIL